METNGPNENLPPNQPPEQPPIPPVQKHEVEEVIELEVVGRPKRSLMELLLDPRTINGLMIAGGGILVVGILIWLGTIGLFDNPLVVAISLGIGNLGLLLFGGYLYRATRYQLAGRAVSLLASVVMPLNLWLYYRQELITLEHGSLWIPALACCVIYAFTARVLRDANFVFALVGGVVLTGLLFLADSDVARFYEILAPSIFLVLVGAVCIQLERIFTAEDSPFSRARFGRAFFRAGHVVLASGLVVLISGQVAGWLYEPVFKGLLDFLGQTTQPEIVTKLGHQIMAIVLMLAAAYTYVYSTTLSKFKKTLGIATAFCVMWSGIIIVRDIIDIRLTTEVVALLFAVVALGIQGAMVYFKRCGTLSLGSNVKLEPTEARITGYSLLGWGFNYVASCILATCFLATFFEPVQYVFSLGGNDPYAMSWIFAVASLLSGAAAMVAAWNISDESKKRERSFAFGTAALAFVFVLSGMMQLVHPVAFLLQSIVLVGSILTAMVVVLLTCKESLRKHGMLQGLEYASLILFMLVSLASLGVPTIGAALMHPRLWAALYFALAGATFSIATMVTKRSLPGAMVVLSTFAAVWTLLLQLGTSVPEPILAGSAVGLGMLLVTRIPGVANRFSDSMQRVLPWTSFALLILSGLSASLYGFINIFAGGNGWTPFWFLGLEAVVSLIAAMFVTNKDLRTTFYAVMVSQIAVAAMLFASLSNFSAIQYVELFATMAGLSMVGSGYLGWFREEDKKNELVSINFAIGSLLSAVPLLIGLLHQRFGTPEVMKGWQIYHEIGVLAVGIALLASGIVARIRWTTLTGAATLLVYIASLLRFIRFPERLQSVSLYMMIGGGAFFIVAVLLSIYRDRVIQFSEKIRKKEGVFQVFDWR